jgi:alpha-galactosidase
VLKLSNAVKASPPAFMFYNAANSSNVLSGGATRRAVNRTHVIGNVGMGGSLTFTGVNGGRDGGTKLVSVDYINADVAFTNTACSNCRNAWVSVNGGPAVQVNFPLSGQVNNSLPFPSPTFQNVVNQTG